MHITFTRTGERNYSMVVVRDDKVTLQVPSFDRPTWLPHDLAHYVVEFNLELQFGFWGRIASGARYPGMSVLEGRQRPHATARSRTLIRGARQNGTESEVLVGLLTEMARQELETDQAAVQALLRQARQLDLPTGRSLQAEQVRQVCQRLRAMQQQWARLAVGQSIIVIWPDLISSTTIQNMTSIK